MADQGMPSVPPVRLLTPSPAAPVPAGVGLANTIGQGLRSFGSNLQADRQAVYGATVQPVIDNVTDAGRGIAAAASAFGAGLGGQPYQAPLPQQVATPAVDPTVAAKVPTPAVAAAVAPRIAAAVPLTRDEMAGRLFDAQTSIRGSGSVTLGPDGTVHINQGTSLPGVPTAPAPAKQNAYEQATGAPAGAGAQILATAKPSARAGILAGMSSVVNAAQPAAFKNLLTQAATQVAAAQPDHMSQLLKLLSVGGGLAAPSGVLPGLAAGNYQLPPEQ